MKKILCLFFCIMIIFSLVSCGAIAPNDVITGGKFDGVGIDGAPENNKGDTPPTPEAQPGMLTAGEWRDTDDLPFWQNVLNHNDWYRYMEKYSLYTNNVVKVHVQDADENPCYNTNVELISAQNTVIYSAMTDINGNAYVAHGITGEEVQASVRVGETIVPLNGATQIKITAEDAGLKVEKLDLMLTIDTTGSMADELQYLQKELEWVVNNIDEQKALSIRVSVNFYRDEDDEYLIRSFDFTDDIKQCVTQMNNQNADGGGDYPEAVHAALQNSITEHEWREDAIKLCFLVCDAPPHAGEEDMTIIRETLLDAADKGIRILPVASSGVNQETEYLLRSFAIMTGGSYIFLTDDSGIGNEHLDPTIGEYDVEPFNQLMVRVIREFCGLQ